MRQLPTLSKSRFTLGLQCMKALYLKCHHPELADPVTEEQRALFESGTRVGELAQRLLADPLVIEADHRHPAEALSLTAKAMRSHGGGLCEAAFEYEDVLVRVDLMRRVGEGFDLIEVKSASSVKDQHKPDAAIQTYVARGSGVPVRRTCLLRMNTSYVWEGGEYDLSQLFVEEDLTEEIEKEWLPNIPSLLDEMRTALTEAEEPKLEIGKHCAKPYSCAFHGHCHAGMPPYPVTQLTRIDAHLYRRLLADGIRSIRDIPADYPGLSLSQRRQRDVLAAGELHIDADLADTLSGLQHPLHFLDFETVQAALPIWPGTRPYQQVPFQWSDHVLHRSGNVEHREFLHDDPSDPRQAFLASLLDALGERGSVITYSSFERTTLRALAKEFPEHAPAIRRVLVRVFDLEKAVKRHVQHPDFFGRSSIKFVLPALVDDLSYQGLSIDNGRLAGIRYLQAFEPGVSEAQRQRTMDDLRAYCGTDTMGMVRVYQELSKRL